MWHLLATAAAVLAAALLISLLATSSLLRAGNASWPMFTPAVAAVTLAAALTAVLIPAAPAPAPAATATTVAAAVAAAPPSPRPPPTRVRAERVRAVAAWLMMGYMLHLLAAEALLVPKLDGGDVGELLRFSQDWCMYSPQPPRDGGWWQVRGVRAPRRNDPTTFPTRNSEAASAGVDVLRGLRDGVWEQASGRSRG